MVETGTLDTVMLDEFSWTPVVTYPSPAPVEVKLLKLDLACGQVCTEGFEGVDIAGVEGVKHVCDLSKPDWPFADNSVDEARSAHFLEHLDGSERITFFNELYRVLKPGAGCLITTPYAFNERAIGDPTHKSLIGQWTYLYFDKSWREANKLTHGPYERIKCDFEVQFPFQAIDPQIALRNEETKQWMLRHFVNAINDLTALVIKRA